MDDSGQINDELNYLWDILIKCKPVLTEEEMNYLKQLGGISDDC